VTDPIRFAIVAMRQTDKAAIMPRSPSWRLLWETPGGRRASFAQELRRGWHRAQPLRDLLDQVRMLATVARDRATTLDVGSTAVLI